MNADQARMEFAPPPIPGLVRALALAIVVHLLLLAVLSLGVQWKRDPPPVTVEAELWSALPIKAAPREPDPVSPPPEPEQLPAVVAKEVIAPNPVPVRTLPDPGIAIAKEKEKTRRQREKEREQEQDRLESERRQKDVVQKALKAQKVKKLQDEKEAREAEQRDKLAREKKLKLEQQRMQSAKTDADAKKVTELRAAQMARMKSMANQTTGSGDVDTNGSAKQASGPSAGYSGKIVERIKSNTNFSDSTAGRLSVKVLVRITPTGSILNTRVLTSSGNRVWDEAVLRSIEKMGTVPPDVDGRIPEKILKEGMELTVTL